MISALSLLPSNLIVRNIFPLKCENQKNSLREKISKEAEHNRIFFWMWIFQRRIVCVHAARFLLELFWIQTFDMQMNIFKQEQISLLEFFH